MRPIFGSLFLTLALPAGGDLANSSVWLLVIIILLLLLLI